MRPTIFTFLQFIIVIGVGRFFWWYGVRWFGTYGGMFAALIGGLCGFMMGIALDSVLNRLTVRYYKRLPTAALRSKLNEDGVSSTFISSLIISVLLNRGDSVESFRDYVFRQLHSNDPCARRAGLSNLALCYPAQAVQLNGFHTFAPTSDDLQRLKDIEITCCNPS